MSTDPQIDKFQKNEILDCLIGNATMWEPVMMRYLKAVIRDNLEPVCVPCNVTDRSQGHCSACVAHRIIYILD